MATVFHHGKPFTPPVVNGFSFSQDVNDSTLWVAEVPIDKLGLFHVGSPGAMFFIKIIPPPPEPEIFNTSAKKEIEAPLTEKPNTEPLLEAINLELLSEKEKEDLYLTATKQTKKEDLASWAKATLGLSLLLENRNSMLSKINELIFPVIPSDEGVK